MNARTLIAALLLCSSTSSAAPAAQENPHAAAAPVAAIDHQAWSEVLATNVHGDTFDYKALKKDPSKLDLYLRSLEGVKPDEFAKWSRNERFAFWIDAYNAYTVKRVVDGYPVASIKDLGDEKVSVWDREFIPLGVLAPDLKKPKLTLNDIENKILRPVFKDARVHAAINCASQGCPPIQAGAFTGEKLDEQLDRAVRGWLADPRRNRFDSAKNEIEISQVFEWFQDDFVRDAKSVQAWIAKYAPAGQEWIAGAKDVRIRHLDYSWVLNEKR